MRSNLFDCCFSNLGLRSVYHPLSVHESLRPRGNGTSPTIHSPYPILRPCIKLQKLSFLFTFLKRPLNLPHRHKHLTTIRDFGKPVLLIESFRVSINGVNDDGCRDYLFFSCLQARFSASAIICRSYFSQGYSFFNLPSFFINLTRGC